MVVYTYNLSCHSYGLVNLMSTQLFIGISICLVQGVWRYNDGSFGNVADYNKILMLCKARNSLTLEGTDTLPPFKERKQFS